MGIPSQIRILLSVLNPASVLFAPVRSRRIAPRLLWLLVIFALGSISCSRKSASVAEPEVAAPPATLVAIDTSKITPLPEGFFGLNVDAANSVVSWTNPHALKAIESLHPAALAYPGLTAANCWDWMAGMAREEWISQLGGESSSATLGLASVARQSADFSVLKGGAPLQQYLNACKSLVTQPLCRANVLYQKPEETAQWFKTAQSLGMPIMHWELGNDVWRREYRNACPSAETYIQNAKGHMEALRKEDPSVKVAACVPAEALAEVGSKNASGKQRKNNSLAKADLRPDIIARQNAIEQEKAFLRSWMGELALQPFFDAVSMDLNYAMRANPGTQPETIFFAICRQAQQRLTDIAAYQSEWFGDKKIWVSDWGISIENSPNFRGSLLHGLALAEMALALANQAPQVERICYADAASHLGLANEAEMRQTVLEKFQKSGRIVDPRKLPLEFAEPPASGIVLQMLGGIFSQSNQIAALSVHKCPRLNQIQGDKAEGELEDAPAALHAVAMMGKDQAIRVAAINRSREPQPVRLVIDRQNMGGTVTVRSLCGESLMPDPKADQNAEQGKDESRVKMNTSEYPANQIELPPYSFSIIESWMANPE